MQDRKAGWVYGEIVAYKECEVYEPFQTVICGMGYPKVRVKIKKPIPYEGWVPLKYVKLI
jgi:hypothetical protein